MTNRVLAAEDDATQATVLRTHLRAAGFDVSMAANGAEALDMLERDTFDIVVSDVLMPEVDGYELCRAVKDRHAALPVILLTSTNDPLDIVNALSAGADNFLRKPYTPEELIRRVGNLLRNKELRQGPRTQSGLELFFLGDRHMVDSDREQILDLLISTFEDLVSVNDKLRDREQELDKTNDEVRMRLAEAELEHERLRAVLSALPQGLAVMDAEGRVVEVNDAIAELLDAAPSSLVGAYAWEAVRFSDRSRTAVDDQLVRRALQSGASSALGTAFDVFLERADGTRVPILARTAPVRARDGSVVGSIGVVEDIGDLAAHDPVTGLPSHGILVERLRTACRADGTTGLLVVAVDRFDRLRDALPAAGGDLLVTGIVRRLQTVLRSERVSQRSPTATAAHLGNGDLAVIASDIDSERDAIVIGEILAEELSGSVNIGGVDLDVDVNVGVGMCIADADPLDLIGSVAASAHQSSAGGGRRVATSDPTMHSRVLTRLQRERELRSALTSGHIVAHYQPQMQLRPGHPVGVEALVRWEHPDQGLLGAGEVIPLAIEAGLICPLGWTVLEQSCRQARRWREELAGGEHLQLSVNVAVQQLAEEDVVEQVATILDDTGFEPTALTLEITETSVMGVSAAVSERLRGIKALGVQIAIDDFGTGYSSLLQLRHLPIDVLKIDQEFVAGMIDEAADAAIVAGTVSLGRALGLELVAEGVETMEQLVQLRVLGCDAAQGFYWSRPLPADELARWWTDQPRSTPSDTDQSFLPLVRDSDEDTIAYLIHELRSPLTAVTGFADLLARGVDAAPAPDLIDGIRRNARELEARLASVSDARRAETGGITLAPEPVRLAELVHTVVGDLGPQLSPHPVAVSGDEDHAVVVSVDRSRYVQALTNLLTNAAKFSPRESPIEVSIEPNGNRVAVAVRDYGPGIPEHRRPELFRRFSRLGSHRKGMGVGLYLSRLIALAHGGSLDYRPAPGGGSVFSIHMPRADDHEVRDR